MAARHERARIQEAARQEVLTYVSQQRTMEAQARHQVEARAAPAEPYGGLGLPVNDICVAGCAGKGRGACKGTGGAGA
jgi:hypothetical protein